MSVLRCEQKCEVCGVVAVALHYKNGRSQDVTQINNNISLHQTRKSVIPRARRIDIESTSKWEAVVGSIVHEPAVHPMLCLPASAWTVRRMCPQVPCGIVCDAILRLSRAKKLSDTQFERSRHEPICPTCQWSRGDSRDVCGMCCGMLCTTKHGIRGGLYIDHFILGPWGCLILSGPGSDRLQRKKHALGSLM